MVAKGHLKRSVGIAARARGGPSLLGAERDVSVIKNFVTSIYKKLALVSFDLEV